MIVSPAGIALVKHFESLRLRSYPDPATKGDPWTIGWGHTGKDVGPGMLWTVAKAEDALANDLAVTARAVDGALRGAATHQCEFDALVSFTFNLGPTNLKKSALLVLHRQGMTKEAASQFKRWDRGAGHVMAGLVARRAAEAKLYLGEPWE